jgi:hypothetical protein
MTPANELEIAKTKLRALRLYEQWKVGQLLPLVQKWAGEGCSAEAIDRRLDTFKESAQGEMQIVLRAVTIHGLQRGAFDGCQ